MARAVAVALEQRATLPWRFTKNKPSVTGIKFYISAFKHTLRNPSEKWNEANGDNDNNFLGLRRVRNEADAFASVSNECAGMESFFQGKRDDAHVIKTRIEFDIFVGNNLLNMYAKCEHIEDARRVFDEMPQRDVVSWNAMIAGYAKHSSMNLARKLFDEMPERDTLSWNTLIAGYEQSGDGEKALEVFCCMGVTDMDVGCDRATFASILKDMYRIFAGRSLMQS